MGNNYIPRNSEWFDTFFKNIVLYVASRTIGASPARTLAGFFYSPKRRRTTMRNAIKQFGIIAVAALIGLSFAVALASCGDGAGGGGDDGGTTGGMTDSLSAFVSTDTSDYAYELSFESSSAGRAAAVLEPKEDGAYSLIVYSISDGKVKGVSDGKIKKEIGKLTLEPDNSSEGDITVTVSGGEMTRITGKTKGGHSLPGDVTPFRQDKNQRGDFIYATNPGNTVSIIGYTGKGGAVTIPEKINEMTVIGIGVNVFTYCALTSVIIPNSVTTIGRGAFAYCGLTSVTIPSGVTSIGKNAFGSCPAITSVTFQGTIPSSGFDVFAILLGDLRDKFYATDAANGTPGTYTRPSGPSIWPIWTKQ